MFKTFCRLEPSPLHPDPEQFAYNDCVPYRRAQRTRKYVGGAEVEDNSDLVDDNPAAVSATAPIFLSSTNQQVLDHIEVELNNDCQGISIATGV